MEASRNVKSGTEKGEFERKARKGSPRESRGGARTGRWGYGKTTLLQEYELPVQTPARSDDLAETHPADAERVGVLDARAGIEIIIAHRGAVRFELRKFFFGQ